VFPIPQGFTLGYYETHRWCFVVKYAINFVWVLMTGYALNAVETAHPDNPLNLVVDVSVDPNTTVQLPKTSVSIEFHNLTFHSGIMDRR